MMKYMINGHNLYMTINNISIKIKIIKKNKKYNKCNNQEITHKKYNNNQTMKLK
jgi:hypothetical protein